MEKLKIIENLKKGKINANDYSQYYHEELQARYDSRKSFYKKAYIIYIDNELILLQSYNTIVSYCLNGKVEHIGSYSQTTSRHQKEFVKQCEY